MKTFTLALAATAMLALPGVANAQQVGTSGFDRGPDFTPGPSVMSVIENGGYGFDRNYGFIFTLPAPERERFFTLIQTQDSDKIIGYLTARANEGSVWAMKQLGFYYARGFYVDYDVQTSLNWFATAATRGDGMSALILGTIYQQGTIIRADEAKAAKWLAIAEENGDYRIKRDVEKVRTSY